MHVRIHMGMDVTAWFIVLRARTSSRSTSIIGFPRSLDPPPTAFILFPGGTVGGGGGEEEKNDWFPYWYRNFSLHR